MLGETFYLRDTAAALPFLHGFFCCAVTGILFCVSSVEAISEQEQSREDCAMKFPVAQLQKVNDH